MKPGTRVGAICDATPEVVRLYGYGVYVGDEVPPSDIQFFGESLDHPNPKVVLDNGEAVWGCECWWGPEEQMKESIGDRRVEFVDIKAHRVATYAQGGVEKMES